MGAEDARNIGAQDHFSIGKRRQRRVIGRGAEIGASGQHGVGPRGVGRGKAELPGACIDGSGGRGCGRKHGLNQAQAGKHGVLVRGRGQRSHHAEGQGESCGESAGSRIQHGLQRLQRRDGDEAQSRRGEADLSEWAVSLGIEQVRAVDAGVHGRGEVVHRFPGDGRQRGQGKQRCRAAHRQAVDPVLPILAFADLNFDAELAGAG